MADNIIKGIIQVEAPGVASVTGQVAANIAKVEQGFKKLQSSSNSANLALINTGRVVQDLPYGFIGIANNLNPLLESFQRLKAESGSTGTALKSLGASLIGAGGIGLALSLATSAVLLFSGGTKKAKEEVSAAKKETDEATQKQRDFTSAVDAASQAVISQSDKLADLKSILIQTSGEVENLTRTTINQGLAEYLFGQKTDAAKRLLDAQIQIALKSRQVMQGMAQVREFTPDLLSKDPLKKQAAIAKSDLQIITDLSEGLDEEFKNIFKKRFASGRAIDLPPLTLKPSGIKFDVNPSLITNDIGERGGLSGLGAFDFFYKKPLNVTVEKVNLNAIKELNIDKAFEQIQSSFQSGVQSIFEGLGETIGDALTGKGISNIVRVVGGVISSIGKAIINLGIVKAGLSKVLAGLLTLPAGAIIGIGVAAVALGKVVSNSFGGFRAKGGPVGGGRSYIVGENGPELFTPGVNGSIIPNHALGSYRGGGMSLKGEFLMRVAGRDLVSVIALENLSQGRLR